MFLLIQSTLKSTSLPDLTEQVFIETCFVSGIMLETGHINVAQTDKVFALMLMTREEADINGIILEKNIKLYTSY